MFSDCNTIEFDRDTHLNTYLLFLSYSQEGSYENFKNYLLHHYRHAFLKTLTQSMQKLLHKNSIIPVKFFFEQREFRTDLSCCLESKKRDQDAVLKIAELINMIFKSVQKVKRYIRQTEDYTLAWIASNLFRSMATWELVSPEPIILQSLSNIFLLTPRSFQNFFTKNLLTFQIQICEKLSQASIPSLIKLIQNIEIIDGLKKREDQNFVIKQILCMCLENHIPSLAENWFGEHRQIIMASFMYHIAYYFGLDHICCLATENMDKNSCNNPVTVRNNLKKTLSNIQFKLSSHVHEQSSIPISFYSEFTRAAHEILEWLARCQENEVEQRKCNEVIQMINGLEIEEIDEIDKMGQ